MMKAEALACQIKVLILTGLPKGRSRTVWLRRRAKTQFIWCV